MFSQVHNSLKKTLTELTDDLSRDWREYPCLEWPWAIHDRYGFLRIGGTVATTTGAHREAFQLTFGRLKDQSLSVCHRCDNRPCFRPIHLFADSDKDNVQDMILKGRRYQYDASGERSGSAKLCEDDVQKMGVLHILGVSNGKIAKLFDVRQSCVSRILTGKHWKKVKPDKRRTPLQSKCHRAEESLPPQT